MAIHAQLRVAFLCSEIVLGIMFADLALSASDVRKRLRNTKNARRAYDTVLRFMDRVDRGDVESMAKAFDALNRKLIELGEMDKAVLGRRLDDRIRKLAAVAEDFPNDSPRRQGITAKIKTEMSQYFEREKNPPYDVERRGRGY